MHSYIKKGIAFNISLLPFGSSIILGCILLVKYNFDLKLRFVKEYLKKYEVSDKITIRQWVRAYKVFTTNDIDILTLV